MLWYDTILFRKKTMRLFICCQEGSNLQLEVSPSMTVLQVKMAASSALCETENGAKTSLYHRLVSVESGRELQDDATMKDIGLIDNDELLLLKRRVPKLVIEQRPDARPSNVSHSAIVDATSSLARINFDKKIAVAPTVHSFQAELRKILVSLIDAAQKLLCLNPDAAKIFDDAQRNHYTPMDILIDEILGGESTKDEPPKIPTEGLKQLTDMGFSQVRATKALLLNKLSPRDSIQWLIEHESDADIDEPLAEMKQPSIAKSEGSEMVKITGPHKVMHMLNTFKSFRRKEFRPNRKALHTLVEMGFAEKECIEALRLHNNSEEEACEWLLSGESQGVSVDVDDDAGLDPASHVYKAIMTNPTVQLGLNNPRSLIAFLHMLDNPSHTQRWLNDPDTGPMLIQVSRIYHAEKHIDVVATEQQPLPSSSNSTLI